MLREGEWTGIELIEYFASKNHEGGRDFTKLQPKMKRELALIRPNTVYYLPNFPTMSGDKFLDEVADQNLKENLKYYMGDICGD